MGETNYSLLIGAGILLITTVLWSKLRKLNAVAPGEPPMLPGALPIVGHAISLVRDASALHAYGSGQRIYVPYRYPWLANALMYVRISRGGGNFSTLAGAYDLNFLQFVFNPRDVSTVWRTKTLSFDVLIEGGLVDMFGLSREGVRQLQSDPDGVGPMLPYNHQYMKEALAQGGSLEVLTNNFIKYFDIELQTEVVDKINASANGYIEVSLQHWMRVVLTVASTKAFMGEEFLKEEQDVIERLWEWERDFQTLTLGLPEWMLKRAHQNRKLMLQSFERHVFDKNSIGFIGVLEELMKVRGMSDFDIGAANFSFWSALQANAPTTAFWVLQYMLFLPGILEKVRAEILPAFDAPTGKITNLSHLINNSPLLNSIYQEVLRFTSAAQGIRKVEEDTVIAGYSFLEGSLVMMPVRPYHFDPTFFGEDADQFIPDRFMRDDKSLEPGQKNISSKMLRAFGGGNILCPGRFFAANEVLAAVATLVHRFEVHVVDGEKMPKPSSKEPTVGTYFADHDIKVRIRIRS